MTKVRFDIGGRFGRGDYAGAIKGCRTLLENDSNDVFALSVMALSYDRMRQWREALETAERFLRIVDNDPMILRVAAFAAVETGHYERGKVYAEQALTHPASEKPGLILRSVTEIARFAAFIPPLNRIYRSLQRGREESRRYSQEWNDWALRYLDWYRSAFPDSGR